MPGGLEWTKTNCAYVCAESSWYGDGASDDGDGRYYNDAGFGILRDALVGTGWRIPTYAEWMAMINASKILSCPYPEMYAVPGLILDPNQWFSPSTNGANNSTGFSARPTGDYSGYSSSWTSKNVANYGTVPVFYAQFHANPAYPLYGNGRGNETIWQSLWNNSTPDYSFVGFGATGRSSGSYFLKNRYPLRLVRDASPTLYVPHGGSWTKVNELHQGGASWRKDSALYVPNGGAWKEVRG